MPASIWLRRRRKRVVPSREDNVLKTDTPGNNTSPSHVLLSPVQAARLLTQLCANRAAPFMVLGREQKDIAIASQHPQVHTLLNEHADVLEALMVCAQVTEAPEGIRMPPEASPPNMRSVCL